MTRFARALDDYAEAASRGVPGVVFASLDGDKYNFIAVAVACWAHE